MSKEHILDRVRAELASHINSLASALGESIENATGAETKSEGKYDTRAVEAAYLAEAQRKQLAQQRAALASLEKFTPPAFTDTDPIALGALVEVEEDDEIRFYLLAPAGGGLGTPPLGWPPPP
ncbi:MAG: hypothetical protein ACQKBY_02415, partial [Verrucomicrobiales bacterium]